MKHLISLIKIELTVGKRQMAYFLLSIGLPAAFYLLFSGIIAKDTPEAGLRSYLFSMTLFSMLSTSFFSLPSDLYTDRVNNWKKMLQHSPVSVLEYYISKFFNMLVQYLLSIIIVFSIGHFFRGVNLPLQEWIVIALILIIGSITFIAMGAMLTLLPSMQLMSVIGNIVFMGLAVLGGLWFPISKFPSWMQAIGKGTPTYQLMQVVNDYLKNQTFNLPAILILAAYTIVVVLLTVNGNRWLNRN